MAASPWFLLVFVWLVATAAVAAPAGAETLPTAAELQARAAAASGAPAVNYRETLVSSGTLGPSTTITYHTADGVRTVTDRGGFHDEYGTYRGEHWQQDANGLTSSIAPDPGHERADPTTTVVTRQTTPFDAFVVTVRDTRRSGTSTYYDPSTGQIVRIDRFDASGTAITTFSDFAAFGSRMLARQRTITSTSSHLSERIELTDYAENVVPADAVQVPSTRRMLVEFPPGVLESDLPVHFDHNQVYIRVTIGNRTIDAALDTGTSFIYIDADFAKSIGLTLIDAGSEYNVARYTGYDAIVPEIRIGDLRMHDIAVHLGPMPTVHPVDVKPLGLFGFDFLAQLGVTIDYQHHTVHVVPAQKYIAPLDSATAALPVRVAGGVIVTSMQVGDAVADHVILDTGWQGELGFFDYFTRRYPDVFREDLGPAYMSGVGGSFAGEFFRIPRVTLGKMHFLRFVAERVPPSSFAYRADGVIGADMLSLFTVGLDYTHAMIYLTPNATGRGAER